MSKPTIATNTGRLALLGALGLALAAGPAVAQPYRQRDESVTVQGAPSEGLQVFTPRRPKRSAIGAPIVNVAMSRRVRFDDLDLTTLRGVRLLHARIRYTARRLCDRIDDFYPVTADGSPSCYRNAVRRAMYQADDAIADARGYSYED